jgi:dipeptidyl aminopeptidase/acylaminoacyl peptidase
MHERSGARREHRRTRRYAALAGACLSAALAVFSARANADTRRLTADDVLHLVRLSSPCIAPDGTKAAVIVSRVDADADTYTSELELVDLRTHAMRPLTYKRKGLSDPAFSPQGDRIAFVADDGTGDDAKSQVFVLRLDGGDARAVTNAPEGIEQFAWRPDGAALAYVAQDAQPKQSAPAKFRDSFVVGNNPITAHAAARPLHVWLQPLDSGPPKQLTRDAVRSVAGGEAQGRLSWSPDGSTLAFALAPDAVLNDASQARIELLTVASGATRLLTGNTNEGDPAFSPDGTRVAYAHSTGDNQITLTQTYVTGVAGGPGTPVTARFDRAIRDFAWAPDGRGLYFTANDGTNTVLGRAALDGTDTRLDLGEIQPASSLDGAIANDGGIVFVGTTSRSAAELYYRAPATTAPVAVTDVNAALAHLALGASQTISFASDTGMTSDAVLLTPPDFSPAKKYPLVLLIHGGPTSASTFAFDALGQLMAARGWLVLSPNYRGSDDHGLAYQSAVRYDPEDGPGRDVDAAVNAVRARGIVDPARVAVSGWSYGGIMTAWMVTHYHYWRAAVSGASVNDWSTDYSVADDSDSDAALFHSGPWAGPQARAEYDRASAVTYAKDVTAPVLILSDVGDNRDPIATSYEFYHALKDNGKDVTFVAWPIPGHFPHDPIRALDVYTHWIDFIAEHF